MTATTNKDKKRSSNYERIKRYLVRHNKCQYHRIVLAEYVPKLDAYLKELRNETRKNRAKNLGVGGDCV